MSGRIVGLILVLVCAGAAVVPVRGQQPSPAAAASSSAPSSALPQPPPSAPPRFEVVSIKRNTSGLQGSRVSAPLGSNRITTTNVPVIAAIRDAYELQGFQLVGGPSWISSERFDIIATASEPLTSQIGRPMIKTMLVERFKLKTHVETREMPMYVLTLAKADRTLEPGLRRTETSCEDMRQRIRQLPPEQAAACFVQITGNTMRVGGLPMARFVRTLSQITDRYVADETQLPGEYAFSIPFSMDDTVLATQAPVAPAPGGDSAVPSLFTSLRENLGLKLEARKGPVPVLVIDSIEMPTED